MQGRADQAEPRLGAVEAPAGAHGRLQRRLVAGEHGGDAHALGEGRGAGVHVHGIEIEPVGRLLGHEVGRADAEAVAVGLRRQPQHHQLVDRRRRRVRPAADVVAGDDRRVHAGAGDVLAERLDRQHVDLLEGELRDAALGELQQAGVGLVEGLRLDPLDHRRLARGVLDDGEAVGDRRLADGDGRPLGQHLQIAARAQPVHEARALRLAEADGHHLGEPALHLAVEGGVRLDPAHHQHGVGLEGAAVEVDRDAGAGLADAHHLHAGLDGAAHGLFREAELGQQRHLARGDGAAVAAHRGHDEGREVAGLEPRNRRRDHGRLAADAAAAAGDRHAGAGAKCREPPRCVERGTGGGGDIVERRRGAVLQRHRHHRRQRLVLELRQRDRRKDGTGHVSRHGGTIHQRGACQNAPLRLNGAAPAGAPWRVVRPGRPGLPDGAPCASPRPRGRRRWWRSAGPAPEPRGR